MASHARRQGTTDTRDSAPEAFARRWPIFAGSALPEPESLRRRRTLQTAAVVAIVATTLYLTWRILATLEGSTLWLSIPLVLLEAHALLSMSLHVFDLWNVDAGPQRPAWSGTHTVAVVITTYNESREVLLPTMASAAALQPAHQTWVLDDGAREWVREIADALGIRYVARTEHQHAKAGNINHALPLLREAGVDIVGMLDSDHVVNADFLHNTLGYFEDPQVALVQTPQGFYNVDSFEHIHRYGARKASGSQRLTPEGETVLFHEQELFYRALAAGRNRWNSAFWCGTSALLRLEALESVGGVATTSVTEDINTTLRLHSAGWKSVYHNEVLARGLAAANADQYLTQRLRWGTGAMQVLRRELPITKPGLTVPQRISYMATLTGWFDSWRTLGYILVPLITVAFGLIPFVAPLAVFLPLFATMFVLQRIALNLLSRGRATVTHSILFEVVRLPANLRATLALFTQREIPFAVTAKGRDGDERSRMAAPTLLVLLAAAGLAAIPWFALTLAGRTPVHYENPWVPGFALVWVVANTAVVLVAIARIRRVDFGAERRSAIRFTVDLPATFDGEPVLVRDISITGCQLMVLDSAEPRVGRRGRLSLVDHVDAGTPVRLDLDCTVRSVLSGEGSRRFVGVEFAADALRAQARLTLALFGTDIAPEVEVVTSAAPVPAHAGA